MTNYNINESVIIGESFTLISVYDLVSPGEDYRLGNPKALVGMSKEKAIFSLKWWRKILADPEYPSFVYDPSITTLFNEDGSVNNELVGDMILSFGGRLPEVVQ